MKISLEELRRMVLWYKPPRHRIFMIVDGVRLISRCNLHRSRYGRQRRSAMRMVMRLLIHHLN